MEKRGTGPIARFVEVVTALTMTLGRGRAARMICDLAEIGPGDRVVDVGCGPGTAVREATRRGSTVTGVDPSLVSLRIARWISSLRRTKGASFSEGSAEALPLSDRSATVVWALSSVHHWRDRRLSLAEARRVLTAGGQLLLLERLVKPGHRGHGFNSAQADELVAEVGSSGFAAAQRLEQSIGRRSFVVISARTADDHQSNSANKETT